MTQVYLNGQWLAPEQARISVFDRGFLFGDGIYEVVPVFGGKPFRVGQHLDRLAHCLAAVRIANPLSRDEWRALFTRLIADNGGGDQALYLQVTRGAPPVREHKFPVDVAPTVFAMSRPIPPVSATPPNGIACITAEDFRWQRCDLKTTSLIGNVLLTQQALEHNARETILLRDGKVQEGASSNVFLVKDGRVYTAPLSGAILGGITRNLIVELIEQGGIECVQEALSVAALRAVDELWISSSTREMMPVTTLDGKAVGNGEIGPIYRQVWAWYKRFRDGE